MNLSMFSPNELPVTDEPRKKKKQFNNILSMQLKRLMLLKGIAPADIYREAVVPFSTLSEWINAEVETQRLDDNIKRVARYFGVSVDYLVFGTPESDRDLVIENRIAELEDYLDEKIS